MDPLWQKIVVVVVAAAWAGLTTWYIQPVPGKGLPIGRHYFRFYLNRRQAIFWGAFLLLAGLVAAAIAIGAEENDVLLMALLAAWLGGLYVYRGLRTRSPEGSGQLDDLTDPLRKRP